MAGETEWVKAVKKHISDQLPKGMAVETGHRLPYALFVSEYPRDGGNPVVNHDSKYQTDLLISEQGSSTAHWVPRVVVEFKLGRVGTHDALTYSAKAATHKNIHPYLRYGIVIGAYDGPVPRRLLRHGHQFDFMLTLASEDLSSADRDQLCKLIRDEARASQQIERLLLRKTAARLFHRKLCLSE